MTEVLVAVAVMVILVGAGAPTLLRTLEASEEAVTRERLGDLEAGLQAFYRDHGRFPTVAEGLNALLTDPGTGSWTGPYVPQKSGPSESLTDSGGQAVGYQLSGGTVTLSSPSFPTITLTSTAAPLVHEWTRRVQEEIARLNDAAESYRTANGSYPTSVTDIVPTYLGADFRKDPWGADYRVATVLQTLFSAGADGTAGNADDIYAAGL